VQFSLEDPPAAARAGGVIFDPLIVDNGTTKFDLEFGVTDTGDGLTATLALLREPVRPGDDRDHVPAASRPSPGRWRPTPAPGSLTWSSSRPTLRARLATWATGAALDATGDPVTLLTDALRGGSTAVSASDWSLTRDEVAPLGLVRSPPPCATPGSGLTRSSACACRGRRDRPRPCSARDGRRVVRADRPPLPGAAGPDDGRRLARPRGADPPIAGRRRARPESSADVTVGRRRRRAGPESRCRRWPCRRIRWRTPSSPPCRPGRPKGVGVTRRGRRRHAAGRSRGAIDLTPDDVTVAVTTLSFDIALWELAVSAGARWPGGDRRRRRGDRLRDDARAARRVGRHGVPGHPGDVADAGLVRWHPGARAGAAVRRRAGPGRPPRRADRRRRRTLERLRPDRDCGVFGASGGSGRPPRRSWSARRSPAPGCMCSNAALRPVPPVSSARSTSAAPGWPGATTCRPALTCRTLPARPFLDRARSAPLPQRRPRRAGAPTAGWTMLGRVDNQVKLRASGSRPARSSRSCTSTRRSRTALVTAYTPPGGTVPTNLVAYVVAKSAAVDAAALRRHLQCFLPDYMIPAVYVPLDRAAAHPERQGRPGQAARTAVGRGGRRGARCRLDCRPSSGWPTSGASCCPRPRRSAPPYDFFCHRRALA